MEFDGTPTLPGLPSGLLDTSDSQDVTIHGQQPCFEPFEVELKWPGRLVVVGDLNGHGQVFEDLLKGAGIVDNQGHWQAGSTVLIQMGDVLNRGVRARMAMDRLIYLRAEARAAGGEVIWLLGNHEVMTTLGHEAYVTTEEYLEFAEPREVESFLSARSRFVQRLLGGSNRPQVVEPIGGTLRAWEESNVPGKNAFRTSIGRHGFYGRYIRALPIVVQAGPFLFVHGGLSLRWAALGLTQLHELRSQIWSQNHDYFQSLEPYGLFRDPSGPLWHRSYCMYSDLSVRQELEDVLERLSAKVMIVGHTRTDAVDGGELGRPTVRHGGRLVMTDIGIGEPGEPGCVLVIEGNQVDAWAPHHGRYNVLKI